MTDKNMAVCPKCHQRFYGSMCIVHRILDDSENNHIFATGYQCPRCSYYASRSEFRAVSIEEVMV